MNTTNILEEIHIKLLDTYEHPGEFQRTLKEALTAAEQRGAEREREKLHKWSKIYCEFCGFQPVVIEPPRLDILGKSIYGDIICSKCRLVIGTIDYKKPEYLPTVESEYKALNPTEL